MSKPLALIVEDEFDISIVFSRALQAAGFETEIIRDGGSAMEWLSSSKPDIVILDLNLPRVSGPEILQYIRADARLKRTPVIVATGYARLAERFRDQADWVLFKPVSFAQLRDLSARLVGDVFSSKCAVETRLPGRYEVEEYLTQLLFDKNWVILLLQVEYQTDIVAVAELSVRFKSRFAGRWSENEVVLVLDLRQVDRVCEQIRGSGLAVSLGMVNGRAAAGFTDAEAIIAATRENLCGIKAKR
jgi:two-component system, cell cycle response regulator DivK